MHVSSKTSSNRLYTFFTFSQQDDTADISASRQKKYKNIWPSSAGPLNGGSTQKSLPDKTNNFAGELNDFVYVKLIVHNYTHGFKHIITLLGGCYKRPTAEFKLVDNFSFYSIMTSNEANILVLYFFYYLWNL